MSAKKEITYCYSNFPLINEYKLLLEASVEAMINAETTRYYGYWQNLSDQMHRLIPFIVTRFNIKWEDVCRVCFTYEDLTDLRHGILAENSYDHLYFLRGGDYIKIGRTVDFDRRLSELKVSSPYELELIALIENKGCYEFRIHDLFKKIRVKGEWFKDDQSISDFIGLVLDNSEKTAYA